MGNDGHEAHSNLNTNYNFMAVYLNKVPFKVNLGVIFIKFAMPLQRSLDPPQVMDFL
jgi:hypothetical protein